MPGYVVRTGDTLNKIAAEKGIPLYALLRANPQIPDKNKIYPGQLVNIPSVIGPPMLPLPPKPKPGLNVPDLPFFTQILAPSLDPVVGTTVIREVYVRYKEFEQEAEPVHPAIGILSPLSAGGFKPWRMVLPQTAQAADLDNPVIKYTQSGGGPLELGLAQLAAGTRLSASYLVVQYRYFRFQGALASPVSFPGDIPGDAVGFTNLYMSGTAKNPPAASVGGE